jgi:hypothetical protein
VSLIALMEPVMIGLNGASLGHQIGHSGGAMMPSF